MKKGSVVVGTGNLAGRPLSFVFEQRTAILLRILDERSSRRTLSLVNPASEINFDRQGRRERIHGLDVVAESRRERLTKVAP